MYIIYATEQDAWNRSEQEGIARGLSYHINGKGTRYVSEPEETSDGQWALDVETYELDEAEEATTVPTFEPKPVPEEEI
jgi:hypothetical protein